MSSAWWDPTLETDDPLVDRQHREICELFDELAAAEGQPEEIMDVLERLAHYTLVHFDTEEHLMRRADYPADKIAEHSALHRELTEATRQKILDFRSGALTEPGPLVEFLREWIVVHLHEQDAAMIEYVRARGEVAVLPEPWASSA